MSKIYDKINNNWDTILDKILTENDNIISPLWFDAFVKNSLKPVKFNKDILYIEIPDEHFINIIKKKYIPNLLKINIAEFLNLETIDSFDIKFIPKNEFIDEEQNIKQNIIDKTLKKLKINKKNTFESFVSGESNNLAYGNCLLAAESPGDVNPLFIYGSTGLGKTHLLQAITNLSLKNNENLNIIYISCQDYVSEYIDSVRQNTINSMKEKYKSLDLLIIDDIEMLSGKKESQNFLFDIFNSLYDMKKQIVFSSDKPPKELDGIQERMLSRFSWGTCCDIQLPDYETRMAILRKKEEEFSPEYKIDEEIIRYIAKNINSNIRELEGCLNKIISASRVEKKVIDLDYAIDLLSDFTGYNDNKITPELIIQVVSNHLNIDKIDICSNKRNKEFVYARDICIYLCRELIQDITQENIGKYFSGKDHSTIIYSYKKIDEKLKKDINLKKEIEMIKNKIPM